MLAALAFTTPVPIHHAPRLSPGLLATGLCALAHASRVETYHQQSQRCACRCRFQPEPFKDIFISLSSSLDEDWKEFWMRNLWLQAAIRSSLDLVDLEGSPFRVTTNSNAHTSRERLSGGFCRPTLSQIKRSVQKKPRLAVLIFVSNITALSVMLCLIHVTCQSCQSFVTKLCSTW